MHYYTNNKQRKAIIRRHDAVLLFVIIVRVTCLVIFQLHVVSLLYGATRMVRTVAAPANEGDCLTRWWHLLIRTIIYAGPNEVPLVIVAQDISFRVPLAYISAD